MKKLSKFGRSTLSVLLCLTMLLTTFCFFDIGSVISEALVSKSDHVLTEAGSDSSTFAKYNILMPELVYIKAGGKDSEYFLNATSSGTVSEPTSETGMFSFSCATARSVTISITVLDANLNASSANRVTNVAFTDGSYMSSDKSLSASSSTVTKTIKSLSMANFEENKQYIIRWNIVYTTASGSYTTYAYTGIKFPLLAQAGMTTRQFYYGTYGGMNGNPAESTTYSFITGVDAVRGGNVGSEWVETGSTRTAPLINFNASLYPRGLDMPIDNNYFNPNGSGVLLAFAKDKTNGTYLGENSRIYNTPWDKSQTYKPMDLITDDMVSKGYFGGKPSTDDDYGYAAADITIDTSRYSDFKQVPNLSAGFVEFDSDGGENQNYLNAIRNVSYTSSDAAQYFRKNKTINNNAGSMNTAPTIYCPDVDRSDEKNDRSWVRGLYKLDGDITAAKNNLTNSTSGGTSLPIASFRKNVYSTYIRFEYSLRFSPAIGYDEYCSGISAVRLNAILADKATARKYYSKFLNSGVNTSANNWSTIKGYVESYVKTLCVSSAAAGSYTDPASEISAAQTFLKETDVMNTTTPLSAPLYFYVPETIYLAPNIDSSHTKSSANFQWFIQNTVNTATAGAATTKQSYDTNGYVYFSYANLDTTQNVSLSATALNASGSVISGGSIKSLTFSDDGVYKKATITQESTSPSLTAATTGYYIRWTVKYTDAVDGYEKQAVAYTYVYKPYIQPSGTAMDSRNEAGDNHDAGNITWVSGVHSDAAGGDRYPNSVSGGNRSMVPFSSTAKSSKPLGVNGTQLYAQFPNWFGTSASNNSPNDWFNTSSSTYLPRKTFVYLKYFEGNGGFWGGTNPNSNHTWLTAPTTYLYVDTSRYSNLKYIPNLSAGLFVTSDKSSDKGAWYVADATDKEETVSQTENQRDKNNFGSARTLYYNYKKIIANEGSFDSPGNYEAEGVKYNGPVDIELMKAAGSEKVYKVKATYFNSQSTDKITNAGVMPIKVYQNDKGDLRKAVMRAQNNFPNLGITYNGSSFNSYFYSGTDFTTFCTNYERAYKELVKLDGRFYSSKTIAAIANELNSAIDNLIAGKSLKTNCTAREYNLGLEKLSNGNYKIIEIDGGEQYEITYDARDNVYFTPDTYEGYTYVGKCALTNETIAPSDYYGKTLASLPTFFSASNLYSNSMSYSGSTVTIGTTTVKTTTVPQFDGDTTAYEWVAAVNDTSLTMVNFYFIDQNRIYFDPNDGSSGVNLLTQPTTYKSGNNFYSPTFTSSPGNGVTATFDQTDSTFTFNGTPTTGAEYFRFPIAGKLKANTNYTYRVVYVSGSKTLDGGKLTLTLDICDKNGNRCYKASGETYSDRFVFDQTANQATTSRTLAPDAYQAANAEFVQVFTYSPSYGTVRYNNYKVKIELVESGSANQTYSPNAIQQFYGRSIGTMPVPVRDNYRFLGWFTAPDGGDRVTASSVMGSTDRTVYAHWAVADKVLLLDNDFNFDDFVRKASNNNAFDTFMNSYKACKLPGMKNPLSYQENDYFSYSIAKDTEGDTALNVKYDRKHIVDAGVDEVFDTFKSNTYTASVEGEYTLTYEYRINDYYSYIKDTTGKSEYDSIVLGFSTNDGYWYNGGQGVSYTENRKTTDGYESVELKRTFTAGTQYFFNIIFYFAYYNNYNELRADMDIKNIVLKDPDGNIVLSSNGMNTVNGTSSFDSDARTITLKPTGTDCYTNTYDNLSSYRSTLEAGKKYTLLMDYQATTAMQITPFIFFYPNATSTSYTSSAAAYIQVPAGSGTVAMQFTVPANNYYQIRFSENSVDGSTVPGALTLGNISLQRTEIFSDGAYVADSSTYLGWVSKVTGSASATAVYVNDLNSRNEKIVSHYQDIDYGAQYDELYVPTREGYNFVGWFDASGTQYTDASGVGTKVCTTDGVKLYSRWTAKGFSLKYNAYKPNDSKGVATSGTVGSLPSPNPQSLKFGIASTISSTRPTLTGYTFAGWSTTSGGSAAYQKGASLSASTVSQMYQSCSGGTYNLYTAWTANKFNVKFNGNGGITETNETEYEQQFTYDVYQKLTQNAFVNSRTVTYDKNDTTEHPATLTTTSVTKELSFKGWTASAEAVATANPTVKYTDQQEIKNPNDYATNGGTTNLYAKWQGVTVTLPTPNRTGYTFAGWYDAASGGTKIGDAGASYIITADKTLYAHWTINSYTVTYDYATNGGTSATKTTASVNYGAAVDLTPTATKSGWTFVGWNTNKDATTALTSLTMPANNVTLYAIYKKTLTANFYSGINKATNDPRTVTIWNRATSGTVTSPTTYTSVWTFVGWTSSTTATSSTSYIGTGVTVTITASQGTVNYYALYKQLHTLVYDANGGSGAPAKSEAYGYYNSCHTQQNGQHTISSTVPTKTGYTFGGWNTNTSGTGTNYTAGQTYTNTASKDTLYAKWTVNSYTVTYDYKTNGGTSATKTTASVNYGAAVDLTPKATKSDWTFVGWNTDQNATTALTSLTMPANNITLYAIYKKTIKANFYWINDSDGKTVTETQTVTIFNAATSGTVTCTTTPADVTYDKRPFTWIGWRTDTTAAAQTKTKSTSQAVSADTSFYAVYSGTLTLSYNANKGTGAPSSQTATQYLNSTGTTGSVSYNKSIHEFTVSTTEPTYSGWTFDGWATTPTATSGKYGASPKTTKISNVSVDTPLYAIWTKTFTVNFYYYNNQVETKTLTIYNGAPSGSVPAPPIAEQPVGGNTYKGRGWSTSNSATASVSVASGANVSVSGNANYYASYEATRKATFYYCTEPPSTIKGSGAAQSSVTADAVRYMNYTGTVADSNYTVPTQVTSSHGNGVAENYIGVSAAKNNSSTVTPTTANTTFYAVYSESLTFYYYNGSAHTSSSLTRYMLSNGTSYNASMSGTVPTPSNIDSKTVWSGNWSYENSSYNTGYFRTPTATGVNSLYAVYNKTVALIYNLNGGTSSAIANTTGTAHLISKNGGVNTFAVSLAITDTVPAKTDYTFLGWADTASATAPQYYAKHTFSLSADKTIYAVWLETKTPNEKVNNKDVYGTEIDVVKGVKVTGFTKNDVTVQDITTKHKLYNSSENAAYQALCEAYTNALNTYKNSPSVDNAKALTTARNNLANAVAPQYNSSDRTYIDGKFTIEYASGVTDRPVAAGEHSVSELNLNHYSTANLDSTLYQLETTVGISLANMQSKINEAVKTIAKNFVAKSLAKDTDPMYSVYENAQKSIATGLTGTGIKAINYVYTGKGNYTYYCYTNTATPTLLLTVDDVVGNGRVCYPTKSKVEKTATVSGTVNSSAYSIGTTSVDNDEYLAYLAMGMGTSMTGGASYYSQKSVIKLTPTFTSGKNGSVSYQIKASDDSYNSASTEFGGNYATTSKLSSGKTSNAISTSTPDTNVTPVNTITIVIDYHETTNEAGYSNSMYIYGDQVINDKWLKQFHILRSSGGASNWEWPKTTDTIYTVDDGTYGQSNYGSFTYTFTYTSGASNNFAAASLGTTDAATISNMLKSTANYNSMKAKKFAGANAGGDGLGYMEWPASGGWNINYYPKNQAYTYVHIVDRWGNVDDKVIYVGNIDAIAAQFKTASVGEYTVLEDGGSGIKTLSLNSTGFEILTDENSTLENNVFRTAGNTVRICTGETNKAYTLTMTDKATNSSTATVKSDENGIVTLSVEDTAYESGVYTFMLNSVEVNLYDGAETDKYVLSVSGDEVDEGETAQITVTTKGDVSKLRFTDEDGNTTTVASFVQNDDGTRTWTFAKARPAGEYTYKITVKVGYEWLDEGDTATLIFNERILDSGKVRSAEYDEETGLYKVTFEGRATKVQFVSEDGMTRTYTRYAEAVKSIKTYDADGNEVNDTARTLDHEVWYVEARLYSGQNYTVVGKFEAGWNRAEDATSTVTGK